MDDLTGRIIRGYELRHAIGAGGFGAVFRAFQPSVEREVAIKVILPSYANQPDFIRRFETEAQVVARLEHPFIVPLFDYWRDPDGAYLVMRLYRGGSLRDLLDRERLDRERALKIVEQVAGGLAIAHRNNVVHRDLKPDNILLDEEGNAYLADFGIAKIGKGGDDDEEEGIAGSPGYMSPEQITMQPVTPRSDIYSLGVILYEMLTGTHPFPTSSTTDLIFKHLQDPLPDLSLIDLDLPHELNDVIQRATAKFPEDRYDDVLALVADVKRALVGVYEHSEAPDVGSDRGDHTLIVNPYKGLRAFEESDAADFFGREALVQQLKNRLEEVTPASRFLAVVGPSGSGKSSVVKAGLIPALRWGEIADSETWFIVEMVPGHRPLDALVDALKRVAIYAPASLQDQLQRNSRGLVHAVRGILPPGGQLLLVIDQFEEVFTLVEDEAERTHFLDLIRTAALEPESTVRIITTLRADFYDRPLLYEGFGTLMRDRTEVVLPLSSEELERAITGPAERVGLEVEPNLLAAIVADVREEPGALPLLQYVLTEVFERREGHFLTLHGYQDSGGALGALARRADEIYHDMDGYRRAIIRQVFLRLVTLGEGTEDTRRRVQWAELMAVNPDRNAIQQVLDTFGKYRLLSFDRDPQTREPTVEVAHEALIREWRQLREWLAESREDVRMQRTLALAAHEWSKSGQDGSFLLRDNRLGQFEDWLKRTTLALTESERGFLNASIAQRTEALAQEAARQAREADLERKSRNRLRILAIVLAVAFVGALFLSGFAFAQQQNAARERDNAQFARETSEVNALRATQEQGRAEREADNVKTQVAIASTAVMQAQEQQIIAEREAAISNSLALAASANQLNGIGSRALALALAVKANDMEMPPDSSQRIFARIAYQPGLIRHFGASADGVGGHTAPVNATAYSPDSTRVLSASDDGTIILWDSANGTPLRTLNGHNGLPVTSVAYLPDGKRAISGSWDLTLLLWDLETGEPLQRFQGHRGVVSAVAVSPDGQFVLSGSTDGMILWDITTQEIVQRFVSDEGVTSLAISPDGTTVLSGSQTGLLTLWDITSGERLLDLREHTSAVLSAAYSPDGRFALSTSRDASILYWNLTTGQLVRRFGQNSTLTHGLAVNNVIFSQDGRTALTASEDGTLLLWAVATGQAVEHFGGSGSEATHTASVNSVTLAPDGRIAVSGGDDGAVMQWDVLGGADQETFSGLNGSVTDVAFGDSAVFASAEDGSPVLFDAVSGAEIRRFALPDDYSGIVICAALSPDETFVAAGLEDNSLVIWDAATGELRSRLGNDENGTLRHARPVTDIAFSPDSTGLVSASDDSTLILWDLTTDKPLRVFAGHTRRVVSVAYSPTGDTILSGDSDRRIVLWDVDTGTLLHRLEGHDRPVLSVAYSPDGRIGYSGSSDTNIIAWDLETGREIRRFDVNIDGSGQTIYGIALNHDGTIAISGAEDGSITLWNTANGQPLRRFLTYKPQFGESRSPVISVAFSPDGQYALSGLRDGRVILWRTPTLNGLIEWTRMNRYLPELTCVQRQQYGVTPLCNETASAE